MDILNYKNIPFKLIQILSLLGIFVGVGNCAKSKKNVAKCSTCKDLANNFDKGLENTAKSNFGGGNTNWEEKHLSSYSTSETRLVEIVEDYLCDSSAKECHTFKEKYEDTIELWWFKEYPKENKRPLFKYLCIDKAQVCCPDGTYGSQCKDCPGGKTGFCNGNGKCEGEGTREGSGKCKCDAGYQGEMCDECKDGYYESESKDNAVKCAACHDSCKSTCWESGPKGCDECKAGWNQDEQQGCVDVDECASEGGECGEDEFCTNTPGSHSCTKCDRSCHGCTAAGPHSCQECAARHVLLDGKCVECHTSCESSCSGPEPDQCDACRNGYTLNQGQGCVDEDECVSAVCEGSSYCVNTDGSYQCKPCHHSCDGCRGEGDASCNSCKDGYQQQGDKCADVDECAVETSPCTNENEKCLNTAGAFKCVCVDGFVRVGDVCQAKKQTKPKKSSSKKDKAKKKKVPTATLR